MPDTTDSTTRRSIIHIGLWHTIEDSRVFFRECVSLSKKFKVHLVCAGPETKEFEKMGVLVYQIKKSSYSSFIKQAFRIVSKLPGDLYHVHEIDSLLLALVKKMMCWRKKIIFDVHEYYEEYAFDKNKLLNSKAKNFNKFYVLFIKPFFLRFLSGIITINPLMQADYSKLNSNTETIYNFPEFSQLDSIKANNLLDPQLKYLVYHGGIKEDRGILIYPKLLQALNDENSRLLIIGGFPKDYPFHDLEDRFHAICKECQVERQVITTGQLPFSETISYLKNNVPMIGLTLFTYQKDHEKAINLKIFEYLYLKIPQVGSDYRIYFKKFILDNDAGQGADYYDLDSQVKAVRTIFSSFDAFRKNCLHVRNNYTWQTEEKKLFHFYETLLEGI